MTKVSIRENMRSLNRSICQSERERASNEIFDMIERLDIFTKSHTIAIYIDLPDEVPTVLYIERWCQLGKRVVTPRIVGETIEFVEYHKEMLHKGPFGITEPTSQTTVEPSEIELMILPGVAFCADGRRLGRGKGFYDRYLSQPEFNAYAIGVGFAHQLTPQIPCEPHDKTLDMVITPV